MLTRDLLYFEKTSLLCKAILEATKACQYQGPQLSPSPWLSGISG